jgi:glycine/D-amino acid oxidase-like deaminating enzyme
VRVGVIGAGVAGALLAWRLRQADPRIAVHVYTGGPSNGDATGASGGMVRGFDPDEDACRLAATSLVELRADPVLRQAAAYQEIGSVYLLAPGADPTGPVRVVDELLPGSASVLTVAELPGRFPFRGLPDGVTAVAERRAGYLSPARLRATVLAWLAGGGAAIQEMPVVAIAGMAPTVRLADGATAGYDAVVIAAGPWTPALLAASGLAAGGLRTKQIQYTLYRGQLARLGVFVDETTGLYGRPTGDRGFQLGLPADRWDVDPTGVRPDAALVEEVADRARHRLAGPVATDSPIRTVASCDCYHDPPGLVLREAVAEAPVFTFTGGSGGAAKTVLAASRAAATALLGSMST